MDMKETLQFAKFVRSLTIGTVKDVDDEKWLITPEGFHNNIAWNVGHIVASQCYFAYALCGLPLPIPEGYGAMMNRDTSPEGWDSQPDISELRELLASIIDTIIEDHTQGKLDSPKPFNLFPHYPMTTMEQMVQFSCVHEGMHRGAIAALIAHV